jgi:hypothetical protein
MATDEPRAALTDQAIRDELEQCVRLYQVIGESIDRQLSLTVSFSAWTPIERLLSLVRDLDGLPEITDHYTIFQFLLELLMPSPEEREQLWQLFGARNRSRYRGRDRRGRPYTLPTLHETAENAATARRTFLLVCEHPALRRFRGFVLQMFDSPYSLYDADRQFSDLHYHVREKDMNRAIPLCNALMKAHSPPRTRGQRARLAELRILYSNIVRNLGRDDEALESLSSARTLMRSSRVTPHFVFEFHRSYVISARHLGDASFADGLDPPS